MAIDAHPSYVVADSQLSMPPSRELCAVPFIGKDVPSRSAEVRSSFSFRSPVASS